MNSRLRALIFAGSRTVANTPACGPAQRCASSAITRSNAGTPTRLRGGDLRRGLVGGEDDCQGARLRRKRGDLVRVGRDRHAKLRRGGDDRVVLVRGDRVVGADGEVVELGRRQPTREASARAATATGRARASASTPARRARNGPTSVLPVPQAITSWPRSAWRVRPRQSRDRVGAGAGAASSASASPDAGARATSATATSSASSCERSSVPTGFS